MQRPKSDLVTLSTYIRGLEDSGQFEADCTTTLEKTELFDNRLLFRCVSAVGVPTPLELSQIEAFESKTRIELSEAQATYLRLVAEVDIGKSGDLRRTGQIIEIKKLQIDLCGSLRAPIRKIPVEALCAIFSLCIPPTNKRPNHRSAPYVLCLVSKAWRDIVAQDPSLWSRIHFDIPITSLYRNLDFNRRILRSLIQRAGRVPLTVSIIQQRAIPRTKPYQFYELLHLLAEGVPLCRHLSIHSDNGWTRELNALEPEQIQRLESVSLRFAECFRLGMKADVFSSLPKLQTADLYLLNSANLSDIALPTPSLRNLSVTLEFFSTPAYTVDNFRKFVTSFINLQRLQVAFHGKGFSHFGFLPEVANVSGSHHPTFFSYLKEITIRCGFRASLNTVLRDFSFPTLESFDLDAISVPVRLINTNLSFSNALRNDMSYFSGLTNLRLIRIDMEDDQLRELLRFTPLLTSLDIMRGQFRNHEFVVVDDDLLDFLTPSDDEKEENPPPLTRLRDLRLYFCPEHIELYANLATRRYRWAATHLDTRDQLASRLYNASSVPRYPFRLYLRFQNVDWDQRNGVVDALGDLAGRVLHSERSHNFMRAKS